MVVVVGGGDSERRGGELKRENFILLEWGREILRGEWGGGVER